MNLSSPTPSKGVSSPLHRAAALARRLVEPSPEIRDPAQRRRAQLLSIILLSLFLLFLSINIGYVITVPGYRLPPADLIGYVFLAFTYWLSRSRYVSIAVLFMLAMFLMNVFQNVLTGTSVNVVVTLSFLIPSYILASIFLQPLWAALFGLGLNLIVALLPVLAPDRVSGFTEIVGALSVGIVVVALCTIWTIHRNQIERDHESALKEAYNNTLEGWSRALEIRDKETVGHSQRVTELTLRLGRAFGLHGDDLEWLHRGALLHDIGKMLIPDTILQKKTSLDEEEWKVMRTHPKIASDMLATISYLQPALVIPTFHHERWNGEGYPFKLKGDQIPLAARIFAVVDVWDALLSDRPYREAWTREKARQYLKDESGKQFDPDVVERFLALEV